MLITATIKTIFPKESIGNINRVNVLVEYVESEDEIPHSLLVTFLNGKSKLIETVTDGCVTEMNVFVKTIETGGKYITCAYGESMTVIKKKDNEFKELERDDYVRYDS